MVVAAETKRIMSAARSEILGKIRAALAGSPPAPELASFARTYQQSGTLDCNALIELFEHRLRDYNAGVYRCSQQELRQTIRDVMATRGKRVLVVPRGFPSSALPDAGEFRQDESLTYEELDRSEGVVTGCALAIATTGTIVLRHTDVDGRRALTLLPDYHLCIVEATQIVETVVEGIRIMASLPRAPLTTISGPSATSDIEMIRIAGVHGPRVLDVILVVQ
jgi:L-lactate dehydrogenase complex protein LldG